MSIVLNVLSGTITDAQLIDGAGNPSVFTVAGSPYTLDTFYDENEIRSSTDIQAALTGATATLTVNGVSMTDLDDLGLNNPIDPGEISFTTTDVSEGTNLYYTESRVSNNSNVSANTSKLSSIENNADVTDATNVNAAGATMNTDTTLVGNSYFLDQDDMSGDDATKVASQQSIKAYVDNSIWEGFIYSDDGLINQTTGFEPFFIQTGTLANVSGGVWTVTFPFAGDYELFVYYGHSYNETTSDFLCHVLRDGSTFDFPLHIEPKDTGGAGISLPTVSGGVVGSNANTSTNQMLLASGRKVLTGITASQVMTLELEFACQNISQEATIYEAFMGVKRIINRNV